MLRIFEYYGRFEGIRGSFRQMPSWCRVILTIVATPGIVLMGLSILAFLVSLLALLLLTVPVYRLLTAVVGGLRSPMEESESVQVAMAPSIRRRHVDVTIIEEPSVHPPRTP